jgi:hypothetical protein
VPLNTSLAASRSTYALSCFAISASVSGFSGGTSIGMRAGGNLKLANLKLAMRYPRLGEAVLRDDHRVRGRARRVIGARAVDVIALALRADVGETLQPLLHRSGVPELGGEVLENVCAHFLRGPGVHEVDDLEGPLACGRVGDLCVVLVRGCGLLGGERSREQHRDYKRESEPVDSHRNPPRVVDCRLYPASSSIRPEFAALLR